MGLYQMAPSRADFTTTLPYFKRMKVKLANGNLLLINRDEYDIASMSGRVEYDAVMKGGSLAKIVSNKLS